MFLVSSNDFANLVFLHLPDVVLLVAIRVVLDMVWQIDPRLWWLVLRKGLQVRLV